MLRKLKEHNKEQESIQYQSKWYHHRIKILKRKGKDIEICHKQDRLLREIRLKLKRDRFLR